MNICLVKAKEKWKPLVKTVIFGLFPLVCAMVYTFRGGHSIREVYLPASYWNDELVYFKQVEGIVNYGLPQGWFGFQELHGSVYPFAAWSPVILLPWVVWGKLFGWSLLSPIYANIAFNMLAMAIFAILVKPSAKTSVWMLGLMALFTPYSKFILSGMSEALFMACGIVIVALSVSQVRRHGGWKIACLFAIIAFLTLGRPYLGLLFLIPVWFALRSWRFWGLGSSVLIVAASAIGYVIVSQTCSSPYVEPIVETEWLKIFGEEGLGAGIIYIVKTLWDKFVYLFDHHLRLAVKQGLFSGSLYAVVGMTALFLGIYALQLCPWKNKKQKEGQEYWLLALLQFVIVAGMILALFLFYRMAEGSRHLLIFIVMNILWLALLEGKRHYMKIVVALLCLYFFVIKAWVPFDWQVPFDDGIIKVEAEALGEQLEENMILADTEDRFDNTVIWLNSDMVDGESVVFPWGYLYMIPEGFGINFCLQDYVIDNIDQLKSAYIAAIPGGDVEKAIQDLGAQVMGEAENVRIYKLR